MEYNKIYFRLIIAAIMILGLLLWPVNTFMKEPWLGVVNGLITNLIAAPFVVAFLYLFFGKKIVADVLPHAPISTAILQPNGDKVIEVIRTETGEIDSSLATVQQGLDRLLTSNSHGTWEDYHAILVRLRGRWVEYIPKLSNTGHQYSIANFDLDVDGKHCFSGRNYHISGKYSYSWTTMKLLPPIRVDAESIALYYIYRREGNPEYADQHGFGKLIAKRSGITPDHYDFVEGFFFNEAMVQGGHYLMELRRVETIANVVNIKSNEVESTEENTQLFFAAIRNKHIFGEI